MDERRRRKSDLCHPSGVVGFDGKHVVYSSQIFGTFAFPLDEVGVIGEYTNAYGPGVDDWFLIFVMRNDECWYEVSMYADGIQEFLEQLGEAFGEPLRIQLMWSTSTHSCITWPQDAKGMPLFAPRPYRPKGFWKKLIYHGWIEFPLSLETRETLARQREIGRNRVN